MRAMCSYWKPTRTFWSGPPGIEPIQFNLFLFVPDAVDIPRGTFHFAPTHDTRSQFNIVSRRVVGASNPKPFSNLVTVFADKTQSGFGNVLALRDFLDPVVVPHPDR